MNKEALRSHCVDWL